MKIHFDGCQLGASTGPNVFALRLARQLFETGHEVVFDSGVNADVSLVFIEPSGARLAKKIVQRLDGIWFNPRDFYTKNANIKTLYEKADGVVFQSEFDRDFVIKWWDQPKLNRVIYNGAKISPVTQFTVPAFAEIRQKFDKIFVCSANWHGQKRLKANTELFFYLRENFYPNSCLIVFGSNVDYVVPHSNVFYAGNQPEQVYMQAYSMADWMIHLAYLDHCPNVIIECLTQETPVICSEAGGTRELVKDFGFIIKEKNKYEFDLCEYDKPPELDFTQIRALPQKNDLGHHADVTIETTMKKYIETFEVIL